MPNIIWNVEFNGENYSLGTGGNKIVVPKDFSGDIKLVGEPFEPANSEFINYNVIFKSSSVEAPAVVDTQKRLAIVNGNKNMKQVKKSSIATALGAVVIGSLATVSVQASASPFGAQQLEAGYMN